MNLITQILNDLRVELADEFDRNFERKAFFGKAWPERRRRGKGTLMNVTGTLRRSIRARVSGTSLVFSSSEPHAAISKPHPSPVQAKSQKSTFSVSKIQAKSK